MKLSVRRSLAALAAGAALVTAGCSGDASGPDRAAVVDGTVISQTELQTTMRELNGLEPSPFQQELTTAGTLGYLIQAPVVIDQLGEKGVVVSESVATRLAQQFGLQHPGEGTLRVIRSLAGLSTAQGDGRWTEQDQAALVQQLSTQEVVVNPRYGTFDPQTASVALGTPEWIRPVDAAP